jgi:hypothetical protein
MANTYQWIVSQLDTAPSQDGLTDVVKTVHWRRSANDGAGHSAEIYGSMGCSTPSETDFTAYPDLTFEQICGWLENGLDVSALNTTLDTQIENIINPPIIVLPLPWVPTPSPTPAPTPEPTPAPTPEEPVV